MNIRSFLAHRSHARVLAAGCVALAAGGVVLLRAPGPAASPAPGAGHGVLVNATPLPPAAAPAGTGAAHVEAGDALVRVRAALAQRAVLADGTRQVYAELRVRATEREQVRTPVAIAVVLDVSGSMDGEKLASARDAVLALVDQMRADDQIALVTYSDEARVVQPLALVRDVRPRLHTVVPTIRSEGGTQIPRGLELGARALAEAPAGRARRVVLVSDGLDGSGVPLDAVRTGVRNRAEGGVTLSSLGIGADYDARFMSSVADAGRGNYEFLRDGAQLRAFLGRELREASATTVERAYAEVTLPPGWRLTRAYGTEAEGATGAVRLPVGALFAGDERTLVLDLAVDARAPGPVGAMGVALGYRAVTRGADAHVAVGALALRAARTEAEVTASRDVAVVAACEAAAAAGRQADAVAAWQAGDAARATRLAQANVAALESANALAPSAAVTAQIAEYQRDTGNFQQMQAGSAAGRAYGLQSGATNRARMWRSAR